VSTNRPLSLRYRSMLSDVGLFLVLGAGIMLTPLSALLAWPGESLQARAFLLPSLVMAVTGAAAWRWLRPKTRVVLSVQEGGIIVLLSWMLFILFSAWPLMAASGLNFTQAVFESVSGWTTTGLSVMDVASESHVILLWRSIMQLAGGAGLAIIMVSALATPSGLAVSTAEGRDQLVPNVRRSAKLVLQIYSGYAVLGILALRIAGMNWFDAVNHAFAAISTGGFSTRYDSIGYWDSTSIESVTMALMILGNINFVTMWSLISGKFRAFMRNGEIRLQFLVLPLSSALLLLLTTWKLYPTLGRSARVAAFQAVTALTTTGFSTVTYEAWNSSGMLIMILLMLIGGGSCSTAGGIKQYRVYVLWKNLWWEIRRGLLPKSTVMENAVWVGDRPTFMKDMHLRQISAFLFLYLLTMTLGTAILTAYGYGLQESAFEFASSLGTVGLSIGITSASAPSGVLWTETLGMILGRLEFFVIFLGIAKLLRDGVSLLRRK
jgi:trk system potassium uptake protein